MREREQKWNEKRARRGTLLLSKEYKHISANTKQCARPKVFDF